MPFLHVVKKLHCASQMCPAMLTNAQPKHDTCEIIRQPLRHQQKTSLECAAAEEPAPSAYPCIKHSRPSLLCRIQHRSASDTPWTLHLIAARKRCQASLGMSCLPWPITWGVGAVVTAQPTVGQLWTGSGTCAMTTQYTAAAIKRAPHSWPTCCSTGVWSRLQECCSVYVMHQAVELTAWVVFCIDSLTVGWT